MNKLFKRISLIFFIFVFSFSSFSIADDFIEETQNIDYLQTTTEISEEPVINSKNVIILDRKTLRVLYKKNAYDRVAMASTTKIMTCIIALENCKLDEFVNISSKAANIHGSTLGLSKDSKITMYDLLYGLMLRSGNDCAIAIAEHISGNVEDFSILMNQKAKQLNLTNTNFVTPHGLDDDNHYTTAYDLAILTNYALKNDIFKKIVSSKNYTITINNKTRTITNTNELLGNIPGVYGVKTGFTFNAGRCLVSSCKRNSLDIIVVVLGSNTKKIRTVDSKNLIEYIFNNFEYYDTYPIIQKNFNEYLSFFKQNLILEKTTDIPILKVLDLADYNYPLTREEILNLNTKIYTFTNFSANTLKDKKIGQITLCTKNDILYSLDINLENILTKNTWKYYYNKILKNYFTSILFI